MKKLISAFLVGLSAMVVSTPAMAHSGDIVSLDYPIWSFNFGAQPESGKSYKGQGVIYTSGDGFDGTKNFWNYTGGINGGETNVTNGQSYDALSEVSGDISVSAPITHIESALDLSGYISSTDTTPITISTNVYGFGLATGHAYVYTEQGKSAAVLNGISGVSTAQSTYAYTWNETSTGITYDVQEYFVWSAVADTMTFTLTGGQMNALQLTPIPPHAVPEPATLTLLGIGSLAGSIMLKRKRFSQA